MLNCGQCGSSDVKYGGALMRGRIKYAKLICEQCGTTTYYDKDLYDDSVKANSPTPSYKEFQSHKKMVITSSVLGYKVNESFLGALEEYCVVNEAKLFVIPIKYKNSEAVLEANDELLTRYYLEENIIFGKKESVRIMGSLRLSATMEHPLAGIDPLSKGKSIVFGHPQVALKTIPTESDYPAIITTTGCVTEKYYTETKLGLKANFNHSHSALVIEEDADGDIHFRHLNFDGEGFYDFEYYYTENGIQERVEKLTALVTGDEHVVFRDYRVSGATYFNEDSIVKTLKPKFIVRHDVLDAYSVSHHHKHNVFTKFAKWRDGYNSIKEELEETLAYIVGTTPIDSVSLIVASNHNDHLLRWLNECDPEIEPWNAEIYHYLMWKMLQDTKMGESGAEYPNPFQLWVEDNLTRYESDSEHVQFVGRNEPYMIHDVGIHNHGDKGSNGARGSRMQFSRLPTKTVIGHSHSPGIEKGTYQTGTSSVLRLEYSSGPSSWHHAHCLIYPNGKRQLIFIVNGKWRA